MDRRGFGDEIWRLALAGDAGALNHAASLLSRDGEGGYDEHRAVAFALALEGLTAEALMRLHDGWTGEWPFPAAYAADVARVRFLAGDRAGSLDALALACRGAERLDGAVTALVATCVAAEPRLWRRALRVALTGGTPAQRVSGVAAIVRARLRRRRAGDYPGIRKTILPS